MLKAYTSPSSENFINLKFAPLPCILFTTCENHLGTDENGNSSSTPWMILSHEVCVKSKNVNFNKFSEFLKKNRPVVCLFRKVYLLS